MSYDQDFQEEKSKSLRLLDLISKSKLDLESFIDQIGKENLEKLKELRENFENNPTDLAIFLHQLDLQNKSLNITEKIKRLEELSYLLMEPYFSRIDLYDNKLNTKQCLYIGKFGFSESLTSEPLIVDWRAKIASIYYKYRYPQKGVVFETQDGLEVRDLLLKRTYEFDNGELIKFYNNDIQLDEKDVILNKLSKRTGGVLEDIVATIQASQMEIIEADPRSLCVVQGCVGSGKSTVAIHKLAYIFFNYANLIKPQNTMLIAKNQILVGYLSTLFPKLGIFDLNYGTIRDLIYRFVFSQKINIEFDLDDQNGLSDVNLEYIKSLRAKVDEILNLIKKELRDIESLDNNRAYFTFSYDENLSMTDNIELIIEDLKEELTYQKSVYKETLSNEAKLKSEKIIKEIGNLIKHIRKLANKIKTNYFKSILKDVNINENTKLNYKNTLIYCYLYIKFFGISEFKKFEYCVVDEGQDFSVLEYVFLKELVINERFCILGDLNQSVFEIGLSNWEDVKEIIKPKNYYVYELTTNYRSTKPIIDYACSLIKEHTNKYLPNSINRLGPEVKELEYNLDNLFDMLVEDLKNLDKSVGVVFFDKQDFIFVSDKVRGSVDKALLDKIVLLDSTKKAFYTPKGLYLTQFEDCKGLEFSKVYVVGLDKNAKSFGQAKKNYVAVSRAMNELIVFVR